MGKWKLAEHQKDGIYAINANGSILLSYDMGLGKTATALMWLIQQFRLRRIENALVVCPASLVPNWIQSFDTMANFEGVGPADIKALKDRVKVTSFQKTYKVEKRTVKHRNGTASVKKTTVLREDVDRRWGAVIVDESHCIGNHDSKQTKACLTLSRLTTHRILLSGTPVSGGGGAEDFSKLYGQMKFLDPGIYPDWKTFCGRYVATYDFWGKPSSYNVKECRRLLEDHAIVARLEDCFDMPGKSEESMPCELAARKPYDDMRKGNTREYGVEIKSAGGQYPKMLQVCSGSLKREDGTVMDLPCSKDAVLSDLLSGTDDAVVVFCTYRASIDRAERVAKGAGKAVLVFDGRSKTPTWMDFQSGKGDVLICQYQSGGVGRDLFRSHTMILFEPTFSSLLLSQALARTYRKGQESRCVYYFLSTSKTVEEKAWLTVRSGKDITDRMMADWASQGLYL